jgi:hypothetical protein
MPVSKEKADLKGRFRDDPNAIALYLTGAPEKKEVTGRLKVGWQPKKKPRTMPGL